MTTQNEPIRVREVMTAPVHTVDVSANGYEAAQAMSVADVRHLVAINRAGEPVGVVSDRDIREAQPSTLLVKDAEMRNKALAVLHVADLMTSHPIIADVDDPIDGALRAMAHHKVGCILALDGKKLVGIVTGFDVVRLTLRLLADRAGASGPPAPASPRTGFRS